MMTGKRPTRDRKERERESSSRFWVRMAPPTLMTANLLADEKMRR